MPAELPGLYWDEQRNRYFPLSSRPKPSQTASQVYADPKSDDHPNGSPKRKRKGSIWNIAEFSRVTCSTYKRYQATREILGLQYSNTSRMVETNLPTFGRIKSFRTTILNGEPRRFIGDNLGWVYTSPVVSGYDTWAAELSLQPESEVSSICISGALATSFGASTKISIQDLNAPWRTSILNLNGVHDAWSSHLQGDTLVLGTNKRAVYLCDIEGSPLLQPLDTRSDVFAVTQQDHLIYTGSRNGSIMRFDKRMDKRGQKLYSDRFRNQARSSILYLETVGDSQLLASHMNGILMTFDLRYPRQSTPLVEYLGHTNTYTHRLGIALDPDQQFLFAAGDDNRIRGWSVQTGLPLLPSPGTTNKQQNPFLFVFPSAVETMQAIMEREGMCLWAGCDKQLYQFYLGQR